MSKTLFKEFQYQIKEDYDISLKVNGETLQAYSSKKDGLEVAGETDNNKQKKQEGDIGRIELNGKWFYIGKNGNHNKLFKKQAAYVETEGGKLVAILKTRILAIILIAAIVIGGIGLVVNKIVNPEQSKLNVKVEVADDKTPAVVVNGLEGVTSKYEVKGNTVNITFLATKLSEENVAAGDYKLVKEISGETTLSFFDFSIFKEQFNKKGISLG